MSSFQRAFLCGLIKKVRPKKIVEVGVSAGGTTALILQCLKMLNIKTTMYSVDLMEKWYRNENYDTGFIAKKIMHNYDKDITHRFLLGHSIPFYLEQIGQDIDFLILDTTHSLPGEILDFLVCLPFLKDGCIVVMHDTIENHLTLQDTEVATKLLFDVVRADEKYYMYEERINIAGLPNIAAFKVSKETRIEIRDVFSAMTMTWGYLLEDSERKSYRDSILKSYGEEYLMLFDSIESLQKNTYMSKKIVEHYGRNCEYLKRKWLESKNVFLYGAGQYADLYYQWGQINDLECNGFLVSDDQEKIFDIKYNLPVYFLSELPYKQDECAIIVAVDQKYQRIVLQNLKRMEYYNVL